MTEEKSIRLEPFDLEKAFNGAKVVTRDGREVTQLTQFELPNNAYCLYGVIDGRLDKWTIDGHYDKNNGGNQADIFIKSKVNSYWFNVHKFNGKMMTSDCFKTKEEALANKNVLNYIKTIEINDIPEMDN